jgi:hypothetical protein
MKQITKQEAKEMYPDNKPVEPLAVGGRINLNNAEAYLKLQSTSLNMQRHVRWQKTHKDGSLGKEMFAVYEKQTVYPNLSRRHENYAPINEPTPNQ